jgi:hypothetical protein
VQPGITTRVSEDGSTFLLTCVCPKSTPATYGAEEFEKMVVDEVVGRAHAQDLMPVGSVFVHEPEDVEPDVGEVQAVQLPEGIRFDTSQAGRIDMNAFAQGLLGGGQVSIPMIRVEAEVSLVAEFGR